jgi:aminobenzoyl-glutamate utilization protein B
MATPIAHKGVVAGAKVEAMTLVDMLLKPELITKAKEYFRTEQGMKQQYVPMVNPSDKPAIYLNTEIMEEFRPKLEKFYYDEKKYGSYLEQLGIKYPVVKK